jgi:hypothetical protein
MVMKLRTCVDPSGKFVYIKHEPAYRAANLRMAEAITPLGLCEDDRQHDNRDNFPADDVQVSSAEEVFEIANALPFRGTTYINKAWADRRASDVSLISLPQPPRVSLSQVLGEVFGAQHRDGDQLDYLFKILPQQLQLALAATATDARDLERLASLSCEFVLDSVSGRPIGLRYREDGPDNRRPLISDHALFDAVANNPHLPDDYKLVMVLRPGAQGTSEIVGEFRGDAADSPPTHVFEYLRKNSYIPWGHYASNMADDAIRYQIRELTDEDFTGLRHLYYQRSYLRLAEDLGLPTTNRRRCLSAGELEELRLLITTALSKRENASVPGTAPVGLAASIWGWNYGFDCSASGYRLHASHQQIHQQYAMVPARATTCRNGVPDENIDLHPFNCGDMIAEFTAAYRARTGNDFFTDYLRALQSNKRMDGLENERHSLIVHEDEHVLLFVPKAQTSQWELQLIAKQKVGNIVEADLATRKALDTAVLLALQCLTRLGATMVTTIEYAKRLTSEPYPDAWSDQRLFYVFLPKLPESPGGFSEAQLRFIIGHYPEDFAAACRRQLQKQL